jgi:hypothetical protein
MKTYHLKYPLLLLAFVAPLLTLNADSLVLSDYQLDTNTTYASASNLSASGGKVTFTDGAGATNHGVFLRSSLVDSFTFSQVGQKLEYSFTFEDLVIPINATGPQMRSGLVFDTATLRHTTSMGTGGNLTFNRVLDTNIYSAGAQEGATVTDWSPLARSAIRFATGNTLQAAVSLELLQIREGGGFDFEYRVAYAGSGGVSNSATQLFENFPSAKVQGVFHGTNWSTTSAADGMTWAVAGAEMGVIPEPSTYALFLSAGALGLVLFRRRRS